MRNRDDKKIKTEKRFLTRRDFIGKTTAGVATAAFSTGISAIGLSS